jgi:hypothetical protein
MFRFLLNFEKRLVALLGSKDSSNQNHNLWYKDFKISYLTWTWTSINRRTGNSGSLPTVVFLSFFFPKNSQMAKLTHFLFGPKFPFFSPIKESPNFAQN